MGTCVLDLSLCTDAFYLLTSVLCFYSVVSVIQVVVTCIYEQHLRKLLHRIVLFLFFFKKTLHDILFRYKPFLQTLTNEVIMRY